MSNDDSKPQRKEILAALKPVLKETDLIVSALAGTTADTYQVSTGRETYTSSAWGWSVRWLWSGHGFTQLSIFALDTDGSMLLAPSILPVIGTRQPKNLYILVFDNEQLFGSRGGPESNRDRNEHCRDRQSIRHGERATCATKLCCARKLKLLGERGTVDARREDPSPWPRRGTKNGWTRE